MKLFFPFVLAISLAFALTDTLSTQDMMACKLKHLVPLGDIENIRSNKMPKSRGGKCMVACLMKKMNMMTSDGKISVDGMKAVIRDRNKERPKRLQKSTKIVDDCVKEMSAKRYDECEAAVKIADCTIRKAKRQI